MFLKNKPFSEFNKSYLEKNEGLGEVDSNTRNNEVNIISLDNSLQFLTFAKKFRPVLALTQQYMLPKTSV